MRSPSFFTIFALFVSARALPLAITFADISVGTLTTADISSTVISAAATSTLIPPSDTVSEIDTAASTSTAIATDTSSIAGPTDSDSDSSSATQTDIPIASATNGTESDDAPATTTDSSAVPSSTAPGDDSKGTDLPTSSTAQPTSTSISFAIPDVPPACLALASGAQATSAPTSTIVSIPFTTFASSDSYSFNATSATTIASNATVTPTATASSMDLALPTDVANNSTLGRRIAQEDLPAVAQAWQDLCLVSGGDIFTNEPCVQLAGINGINALLADADPCAQQDNADAMIDFAKSPGVTNADALIVSAVAYRQHPRNALDINGVLPSTPFCQRAPRNAELAGVVNGQLDGVNVGIFGSTGLGLFAFGAEGSCPFGQVPDVTTCSCS